MTLETGKRERRGGTGSHLPLMRPTCQDTNGFLALGTLARLPDLILAPGSRGAILAELILNKFNRNIPAVTGISFMEFTAKPMPLIRDYFVFSIAKGWNIYIPSAINEFKDGKVLIVDDFCLTGEFFQGLRAFLVSQGFRAENVRVFCAVITKVTQAADRAPEYYHVVTDDDNFYFPWGKAHTG